jgi:hypothetical protein
MYPCITQRAFLGCTFNGKLQPSEVLAQTNKELSNTEVVTCIEESRVVLLEQMGFQISFV